MATTSPILGLPLPSAGDTDQVPSDLLTLITAAEKYFVGRFATASARTTAIPAPIAGMVSWLTSTARLEKYNGSAWGPLQPRTRYISAAPISGTGFGAASGSFYLANGPFQIPTQVGQYRAEIKSNLLLSTVTASADFVVRIQYGATGTFSGYVTTASPAGSDGDESWISFGAASTGGFTGRPSMIWESTSAGEGQDFVILVARANGTGTASISSGGTVNRLEAITEYM